MARSPYPRGWKRVSSTIRRLAHDRCELCGSACPSLSVHHLGAPFAGGRPGDSRDKHDIRRENLVAVCFRCHDRADGLRKVHQDRKQRNVKRQLKRDAHRSLGVGSGLVLYGSDLAVLL